MPNIILIRKNNFSVLGNKSTRTSKRPLNRSGFQWGLRAGWGGRIETFGEN